MPHATSAAPPGLQALILCGPGSSFPTFTANPDENPKALLPIANRPMVWYPIDFCYRSGITNITLICPASAAQATQTALDTNPFLTSLPTPKPDLLAPKDLDQNTVTADILRLPEVREIVNSDFVVLPCDLVCALAGEKLLQAWMVRSASLTDLLGDTRSRDAPRSGGLGVYYDTRRAAPVKGEETDFIAITPLSASDPSTEQQQPRDRASITRPPKDSLFPNLHNLVYSMPTDSLKDLTDEKSSFPIRHGLLRKHPRVRFLTRHRDAHIYVFPRWVMDFVAENRRLESIGEDVIGWWVKAGWQAGLAEKLGLDEALRPARGTAKGERRDRNADGVGDGEESERNDSASPDGATRTGEDGHGEDSPDEMTPDRSANERDRHDKQQPNLDGASGKAGRVQVPPMLAYVHPNKPDAPLIRRVDTSLLLLATSLELAKLPSIEEIGSADAAPPFAHVRKISYPEGVKPRTTITSADSLVAENVTVEEKVAIRESVVGVSCQIKEGAKLHQCLLMDGVVVGKNVKLTRCVLGRRCEIGEGSVLTDCEVQENLLVEPNTEEKQNNLMSSAGMEASETDLQELGLDEDGLDPTVEQAVEDG